MVGSPSTFKDQFDFIKAFITWLKALVARLVAERQVAETKVTGATVSPRQTVVGQQHPIPADEAERKLSEARAAEEEATSVFEARVRAHREDDTAPKLAIDRLCETYALDDNERRIVLVLLVPCVHPTLSEQVFGELAQGFFSSGICVAMLAALLDPQDICETVEHRRYFERTPKMVEAGLVVVEHIRSEVCPCDLWDADVKISAKGFRLLTGQHEADE